MCGGTKEGLVTVEMDEGLSPRVRGNLNDGGLALNGGGSIPACAGEPSSNVILPADATVYPRVCGGTPGNLVCRRLSCGLSPRVRGNRGHSPRGGGCPGSIPACAGEPLKCVVAGSVWRVYPRVCGGTPPPTQTTAAA